jgi:spore coat polysaccharide biosynthesis protein SpsF (cytidylyltransferase family)
MHAERVLAVVDLGGPDDGGHTRALYALRRLGSQTLLQRVLGRIHDAEQVSCTAVVGGCPPPGFLSHDRQKFNFLDTGQMGIAQRLLMAAEKHRADWVVYVPVNRPFVDPVLIDLLVAKARRCRDCDYVGYYSQLGGWRRMNQLGLAAEVCHIDALRRLRRVREPDASLDPDAPLVDLLQSARGDFQLQFVPVPAAVDREDLRFVVSDESDWHQADLLNDAVMDDETQWQPLATLVSSHPELCHDMRSRNRVIPR